MTGWLISTHEVMLARINEALPDTKGGSMAGKTGKSAHGDILVPDHAASLR
jgi:hypothetical protein